MSLSLLGRKPQWKLDDTITWPASALERRSGPFRDAVHSPCPTMPQRPSDQVGMRVKESWGLTHSYTFVFKTASYMWFRITFLACYPHHWRVVLSCVIHQWPKPSVVFPPRHLWFEHFLPREHLDLIHHPLLPQRRLAKDVGSFLMKNSNASDRTIPLSEDWFLNHASSCIYM